MPLSGDMLISGETYYNLTDCLAPEGDILAEKKLVSL